MASTPTISYPTHHRDFAIRVNDHGSFNVPAINGFCFGSVSEAMKAIDRHIEAAYLKGRTVDSATWYEVEYSIKGADDWFSTNTKADTVPQIKERLADFSTVGDTLEFRIVEKTLSTAVICLRDSEPVPFGTSVAGMSERNRPR